MKPSLYCLRCGHFHAVSEPCFPHGKPGPDKSVKVPEYDRLSEGCDLAKCQPVKYHMYTATHSGWFHLCPILLADMDQEAVTPLPRWWVPDWWFDFNFWLNDQIQWAIGFFKSEMVGYLFYAVKPLREPKVIKVKAE